MFAFVAAAPPPLTARESSRLPALLAAVADIANALLIPITSSIPTANCSPRGPTTVTLLESYIHFAVDDERDGNSSKEEKCLRRRVIVQ